MIPINKRNVGICILLSIVTFGIYLIFWEYLLVKNTKAIKKDTSNCAAEVLCLIFVPYYFLFWWFTRGKLVKEQFAKHGYSATGNEIVYLILGIFGLPIVSMAIMQNDFNSLTSAPAQSVVKDEEITHASIRHRNTDGMSHIPEDRHKHGLVLDYTLEENLVLQRYFEPQFENHGFIRFDAVREYADELIENYDIRSGQGAVTPVRSMSGGNQQKAIVARELDREHDLLIAVQPTRGLDVGAIEHIHSQIVASRDAGAAVLLVSLELDEVMNLSDRILVMYEGEIVGEFDPKSVTVEELGLYMAGAKKQEQEV